MRQCKAKSTGERCKQNSNQALCVGRTRQSSIVPISSLNSLESKEETHTGRKRIPIRFGGGQNSTALTREKGRLLQQHIEDMAICVGHG